MLVEVQQVLLQEAEAFQESSIVDVTSYDELKAAIAAGGSSSDLRFNSRAVHSTVSCGRVVRNNT